MLDNHEESQPLAERFAALGGRDTLDIVFRDGGVVVKLPAASLFDPGGVELSRRGEAVLREVAVALRGVDGRNLVVDWRSAARNDSALSSARAVAIVRLLSGARGRSASAH